jgi:hypothetical protein
MKIALFIVRYDVHFLNNICQFNTLSYNVFHIGINTGPGMKVHYKNA